MSDDADDHDYDFTGMTVWFDRDPKEFKGNPFGMASDFGKVLTIGRGNCFDEADIYRAALEDIVALRGYGKEFDIANAALEKIHAGRKTP